MNNKLPRCEQQVLSIIYSASQPLALQETMNAANDKFKHNWKPQTVSTFLRRLVMKGYLSATRKGRYTYYAPVKDKKEYCQELLEDICELYFEGDMIHMKEFVMKDLL